MDPPPNAPSADLLKLLRSELASTEGPRTDRRPPDYGPLVPEFNPTVEIRRRLKDSVPRLYPTLIRNSNGTRSVTVSEGRVPDIIPKADPDEEASIESRDGVQEWPITGIWNDPEEGPTNLLKEHPITSGQVVGIAFPVDVNGFISDFPNIEVRDYDDRDSTHYTPPVGLSAGAPGDVFVGLARLMAFGTDAERLEIWDGVQHVHDTPSFLRPESSTGIDIFKQYNLERGCYETFGLKAKAPLEINPTPDGNDLEWVLSGGLDFDLTIYTFSHDRTPQDQQITFEIPSEEVTITSSGEHDHIVEIPSGGDHQHMVLDELSTSVPHTHPADEFSWATGGDGKHVHTFTIPARTVTASVTIQTYKLTPSTSFIVYCWRAGIFVGEYPDGAPLPEYTPDTPLVQRKIWVWNGEENDPSQQLVTPI